MQEARLYEDIVFKLPAVPRETEIAGNDLPKKEQKWRKVEILHAIYDKEKDEIDDLYIKNAKVRDWIDEENRRCIEGYWFYINGKPTYITGDHYFYLNYFKLDVGYPEYRDVDRRWFYVWEVCNSDSKCLGIDYLKKRRDGFSYRAASIILNDARKTFNSNYGMVSKTGGDAKELFDKIVYAFQELPPFFKPQVQSAEDVKKELVFKAPVQKITSKNKTAKKEISLNTKISWKNTADNAYDSYKLKGIIGDEVGKWEEADFEKWMQIVEKCLTLGGGKKIIGKALVGTTVNEPLQEGTLKKRRIGAKAFENIWHKSSSRTKTSNGQTLTGMYRYFVPAYDGLEGFIGEYGESIIETPTAEQAEYLKTIDSDDECIGAREFLENKRKAYLESGDLAGYYEECRMHPFDETDAFREGANKIHTYDIAKIFQQLDHNKIHLTQNPHLLVRGNFIWENGQRDTKVVWHPCAEGRWLISWMPKPEDRNKMVMRFGKRSPANNETGCFGLDPYDNKVTTDNRKSNAACYGTRKFDIMNPYETGVPILEYVNRPSLPEIMWEDMILQCVYYGWEILVESNKIGTINYFRMRGYENYLMDRPEETQTAYSSHNQKEKGIPLSGEEARQALVYAVESFVVNYVGLIEKENEEARMGQVYFDNLLKCLTAFDFDAKWTKFDEMVGFGLSLLGNRKTIRKPIQRRSYDLFDTYKVSGTESYKITPNNYI
jgi:hypothetical protein